MTPRILLFAGSIRKGAYSGKVADCAQKELAIQGAEVTRISLVDYPLPIMICIHLPPGKKSIVAELFDEKCALDVREAEDKEPIQPGTVYFAPPDYHLMVEPDRRLSLSSEEPVLFSRPSINVLFETAADAYGPGLLGIVLTGANNDGAQGLSTIMIAGGTAIIEDPADAYAAAMPQAAIDACPGARVMGLDEMAIYLRTIGQAAEAST